MIALQINALAKMRLQELKRPHSSAAVAGLLMMSRQSWSVYLLGQRSSSISTITGWLESLKHELGLRLAVQVCDRWTLVWDTYAMHGVDLTEGPVAVRLRLAGGAPWVLVVDALSGDITVGGWQELAEAGHAPGLAVPTVLALQAQIRAWHATPFSRSRGRAATARAIAHQHAPPGVGAPGALERLSLDVPDVGPSTPKGE